MTTHSPYILTECNNLCYAGRLATVYSNVKELEKLIGKWHCLDVNRVSAFKLEQTEHGTEAVSLMDKETGELMAEKIDEISREINRTYTKLYCLEEDL